MSTLNERLEALLSRHRLPELNVDGACYRRLLAMHRRLLEEDPTLGVEPGQGFEHVVYAAIMAGLRASEDESGVSYDENTGRRL